MKPTPSSGAQRPMLTWSKFILTVITLGFVLFCTVAGISITPFITPFGLLLSGRWITQIFLAYLNNKKYITVLGRAIVDGLYRLAPNLPEEEVARLEAAVGKMMRVDQFLKIIYSTSAAQMPNFTAKLHLAVVANLKEAGYKVERSSSIMVPAYGLSAEELVTTLEAVLMQTMPPLEIWVILNDPKNYPLIEGARAWARAKKREITRQYRAGEINEERYHFLIERIRVINLTIADKRTAMAVGWLSTHNIPEEQAEPMVQKMFDHPEQEVELPTPNTQISVNLDSDTLSHSWALFMTYLCFVLFDLSGLTSNVRIKNMPKTPWEDKSKPLLKRIFAWVLLWMTYFRYDEANNKERAAESFFNCVVCMSGPWMAIETSLVGKFIGSFVNFTYKGVRIRQGDDRYTTYQLNKMKKKVGYCPWVETYTDAPDILSRFYSQQDRWTVSMFVVFFTSIFTGQIWMLHPWSILDQFYAAGFSFVLAGVILRLTVNALITAATVNTQAAIEVVLPYAIVFVVVNFLRGAYSAYVNKKWLGFLNSFYFIVVLAILFPIKLSRLFVKGLVQDPKKHPPVWGGRPEAK